LTSEAPAKAGSKAAARRSGPPQARTPRQAPAGGPIPNFTFEPHHCFACGELNEHGLHLELHVDAEGCWTELTLEPRFQGWESVAHGGIVASILDEVMAWSVIGRDTWGVTARLNVAFHRPIPIGRPIRGEGWVTEDRRRSFRTASRILDLESGEVLATGEGAFVAAPPDQLAALKARYRLRPAGNRRVAGATGPTETVPSASEPNTDAAATPGSVAPSRTTRS
jgi:acyl-coenzyme A thioesterase PaaI-like protein